jgi:hypothetical protein
MTVPFLQVFPIGLNFHRIAHFYSVQQTMVIVRELVCALFGIVCSECGAAHVNGGKQAAFTARLLADLSQSYVQQLHKPIKNPGHPAAAHAGP